MQPNTWKYFHLENNLHVTKHSLSCLWTTLLLYSLNSKEDVGYKNLNKAPAPHVISMTEESIARPRRPHARTVRSHQWHIARGGPIAEKKLRRGVSPDMTEGVVTTSTFNASHQTSWLHLCGEDPWTVLLWLPQLTRDLERCLMEQALKYCTARLTNEGPRSSQRSYIM